MGKNSLPRGLAPWHPVCLVSTVFGCGLLPWAPGTWGSLAALPLAWYLRHAVGPVGLVAAGIAVFAVGLWAASVHVRRSSDPDPAPIVVDELAAQMLVLAVVPPGWVWYLGGFALFRAFDILKPWPVSWAERRFEGGLGVMLDDIFAALYAGAILYGAMLVVG